MNRGGWKKFLILLSTLLALVFTLFTDADAQDLNMVVEKRDIHPKLQSSLWELGNKHETGLIDFQAFARSRKIIIENENEVTVYLVSVPGTPIDEASLQAYGAEIIKSADNVMKARVPVNMLEVIANNVDGVSFIKFPDKALPLAVESEGVGLTGASSFHSAGHTGTGAKVAVIDVGFAGLSSATSNDELPSTVVKIDCTGTSCVSTDFSSETEDHGTAVAEIVYDMAPGAQLYLIKIYDSLDLIDAKDYCVSNGIKIINHSVIFNNTNFYSGECYSSNPVCTAEDAYSEGILWVNGAGNDAESHYEATFSDTDDDGWHNVLDDSEVIKIEAIADDTIKVYLTWNAWPTTDQDYDLYLIDSALENILASSTTRQTGTQEPTEEISYSVPAAGTYYVTIFKQSATSNHKFEVYSREHNTDPVVASSSLSSPADASNVMAVGAINHTNWTIGPQEPFSSQGPTNDGRTKPEISGPDEVSTKGGTFVGTSAATPHVSGAAALILSNNPTYSVSQLWDALTSSAVDMGTSGQDSIYGHGRLKLPSIPPTATTGSATSVTSSTATLNGTVHPSGLSTTYHFEYGTGTSYGSTTDSASAGSGTSNTSVSNNITGLSASTTYHYRLVATNSVGTSTGSDQQFATSAPPVPEPTPTPTPTPTGGGGGGCFIATAAYGSPMEPNVQILRQFRDRFLLDDSIGKRFVSFYYFYSPPMAEFIKEHIALRTMVRVTLLPVVGMSWIALNSGLLPVSALMFFCFMGVIGLISG